MTLWIVCDLCKKKLYEVIINGCGSQTFHSSKHLCDECSKKLDETEEVHLLENI